MANGHRGEIKTSLYYNVRRKFQEHEARERGSGRSNPLAKVESGDDPLLSRLLEESARLRRLADSERD